MPWLQVRLAITPEQAAHWEDVLLDLGADSVTFMDGEDQPIYEPDLGTTPLWNKTSLLALFDQDSFNETALKQQLDMLCNPHSMQFQIEALPEQDWERCWMDSFQPMQFGQRLWVVPSWHAAPEPDAVNLLLDPGLAFGTGTHPTTALCLEWLDQNFQAGTQVLDFGCGSGILAIASLLLGAEHATCTDIDPQALEATADNAQRNHIDSSKLTLHLAANMPQTTEFDVVLANILAGPLVELSSQLARHARLGGQLVLSGILREQADEVRAAYAPYFDLEPTRFKDEWVCITGTRNSTPI